MPYTQISVKYILKIKGDKIEKAYINIHDDSYMLLSVRRNYGSAADRWRNYRV